LPVEDINGVKMGQQFVQLFESTESTSELWLNNADVIAWILIIVILFGIIFAIIFFVKSTIGKRLGK